MKWIRVIAWMKAEKVTIAVCHQVAVGGLMRRSVDIAPLLLSTVPALSGKDQFFRQTLLLNKWHLRMSSDPIQSDRLTEFKSGRNKHISYYGYTLIAGSWEHI